jgi:hypothetical protein
MQRASLARIAWEELVMIKKVEAGYQVLSEKGKNLGGPYKTLEEARKRLRAVEFFKHHKVAK